MLAETTAPVMSIKNVRLRGGTSASQLADALQADPARQRWRLGITWDPTNRGRAKISGAWRPIHDRSFAGEVSDLQTFTQKV